MSEAVISVRGLSKLYRIGARRERYRTFRDAIAETVAKPFRRHTPSPEETIWALKDVSFDIQQGEVVGVIGRNGAGKSTLLKILSEITYPTEGRIEIRGRVGSLLEVGTGFHPELTGRENIFLNGAILGMRRGEIHRKFDEIVAFAEIEKFIDTPVKRYSSGMYVRLAFAVAAHLEPEILLVDEVLAVGDVQFQKKCLGKIGNVAHTQGRTVLFVSHNMMAVQALCSRCLLLSEGQLAGDGDGSETVAQYIRQFLTLQTEKRWEDQSLAPSTDRVRLRAARVVPSEADAQGEITVRTPFDLEFEIWNLKPETVLNLSVQLLNEQSVPLFTTVSVHAPGWENRSFPRGLFRFRCHVPGDLLNSGTHRVVLRVVRDRGIVLLTCDDILLFDVLDSSALRGHWHGKWEGMVRPALNWEVEAVGGHDVGQDARQE